MATNGAMSLRAKHNQPHVRVVDARGELMPPIANNNNGSNGTSQKLMWWIISTLLGLVLITGTAATQAVLKDISTAERHCEEMGDSITDHSKRIAVLEEKWKALDRVEQKLDALLFQTTHP